MFKREHAMRETYDILTEAAKERDAKQKELTEKKMKEKEDFYDAMNRVRKQRELEESNYENTSNALYDNHLQTVIEAIYISAVNEVFSLTDDGIAMAQRLVTNYIKENGGAKHIMESKSGKTYLLDFIFECASTARDKDMITFLEAEDADKEEDEEEKKKAEDEVDEDKKKDNSDPDENESGEEIKVGDADGDGKDDAEEATEDSDKSDDDKDSEENKDSDSDDSKEESEAEDIVDQLDGDDDDDSSDSGEDSADSNDSESSEAEKSDEGEKETEDKSDDVDDGFSDADAPDPGMEDAESSTDDEFDTKSSKEDMFEKLENDDTVASAVDVIAKRVADAEAEFIKKNAEDKQKIEAIADKIDERIKAVTDTDKSGEEKEAEQTELKQEATHMITNVREDRPKSVFESMFNINADAIIRDKALMEAYSLDNGKLDMNRIEEATVVQYAFLEFLNTVQLENVNEEYIAKVLKQEV